MSKLYEEAKAEIQKRVKEIGVTRFLEGGGFHRNTWYNVMNKNLQTNGEDFMAWLEGVGGQIIFSEGPAEMSREVCFVDAKLVQAGDGLPPPSAEDYFAVPLVDEVGAGAGRIPENELRSWLLVWRWQSSVRRRSNLIAVEVASGASSMEPALYPGDIVLIDRDERRVEHDGRMWLVRDPLDDSARIKRVAVQDVPEKKDSRLTFYSDNPAYPPETYWLKSDFMGDLNRAIVGRVVWAWSDVSGK